jgi:hypothetical protein
MSNTFKEKLEDIITEIPANLPGQFSLYGHIFFFFALGSSNSEGAR